MAMFVITGGGSGAKVAESLVHLCAAGLGPDELHVLLIDPDTQNGNLTRTIQTIEWYQRVGTWPWTIKSPPGQGRPFTLFRANIHCYKLQQPIDTATGGGLDGAIGGSPLQFQQVMQLLYDPSERSTDCRQGFNGRPNLGCLVLGDHLLRHFLPGGPPDDGTAAKFIQQLGQAVNHAQLQDVRVPILVAAAPFGGTGASLLPIARSCIEQTLQAMRNNNAARLEWGQVLLLPFFRPTAPVGPNNPASFETNTSSALQFYQRCNVFANQVMHLIGSVDPHENLVDPIQGGPPQINRAFFQEVLAALAVLDFLENPLPGANPIRIYSPLDPNANADPASLRVADLPYLHGDAQSCAQLACLFHLASFFMREDDSTAKKDDGRSGEHHLGLHQYFSAFCGDVSVDATPATRDALRIPWFEPVALRWARTANRPHLRNARDKKLKLAEAVLKEYRVSAQQESVWALRMYFKLLIEWGASSLMRLQRATYPPILDIKREPSYACLHNTMCQVTAEEIDENPKAADRDDLGLRLCRAALAAMMRQDAGYDVASKDLQFKLIDDGQIVCRYRP